MLLWYLGAALLVGSSMTGAERRAQVGETSYTFTIPYGAGFADSNNSLIVNEIQEDKYLDGHTLVAVGNSIYTVYSDEYSILLTGAGIYEPAGYSDGVFHEAVFNNIAGFAQLTGGILLIADENNQCIRKFYRDTGSVETYAGNCNYTHYYDRFEYKQWQTFNKPTKLAFDGYSKLYVLDMLKPNSKYAVMSKYLYGEYIKEYIFHTYGGPVNDFIYDGSSHTIAVAGPAGVTNTSVYTGIQQSELKMADAYGLATYDDILIVTNYNNNTVTFIDGHQSENNFTICGTNTLSWYYDLPTCILNKPASVAVVKGWLYIGSTVVDEDGGKKVVITKISFSTPDPYGPETTTTASIYTNYPDFNFPTFYPETVAPIIPHEYTDKPYTYKPDNYWNDDNDDDDYYEYDDTGMDGGTVAIIVVVTIVFLGLKICLITWRVRRYRYRVCTRRVIVASSTTVRVQSANRTRVPYGRLQEVTSETPATPAGSFPEPPPYSPGAYTPPPVAPAGAAPAGAAPADAAPTDAAPADAAPPAYTQIASVVNNPPAQSPPNTRY